MKLTNAFAPLRAALIVLFVFLGSIATTANAQTVNEIVAFAQGTPAAKNYTFKFLVWTTDNPDSFRTLSARFDDEQKSVYTQLVGNSGYVSVQIRNPNDGERNTSYRGELLDFRKGDKVWAINGVALLVVRCYNVIKNTGTRQTPISLPPAAPVAVYVAPSSTTFQGPWVDTVRVTCPRKQVTVVDKATNAVITEWEPWGLTYEMPIQDNYSLEALRKKYDLKEKQLYETNCMKVVVPQTVDCKDCDKKSKSSSTYSANTDILTRQTRVLEPVTDDQYYTQTTSGDQQVMMVQNTGPNWAEKLTAVSTTVSAVRDVIDLVDRFTGSRAQVNQNCNRVVQRGNYWEPQVTRNDQFSPYGTRNTNTGAKPICGVNCDCDNSGNPVRWYSQSQGGRIQTANNQGGGDFFTRTFGRLGQ